MRTQTKNARFADNPAFNKYIELLQEHERALVQGDRETADRIADEACDLSTRFTYEENQWLHGISGDLKVLTGNETFLPTNLGNQEIKNAILLALQRGDADTALTHLRHASFVKRAFLAYFFAQAYELEGCIAIALDFMRCAIELDPEQQFFTCMLLQMLDGAGRSDEAVQLAQVSLKRPNATPLLRIAAAGALRVATRSMDDAVAWPLIEQAADDIKRLLGSHEAVATLDPESYYMAVWLLASCIDSLGQRDEALSLYSLVISLNPNDPDAYAMRGHLLMAQDEEAALIDYRFAVEHNTHACAPYLVLANEALKKRRYREAHTLSTKMLSLKTGNPETRATALEFLAIASYELGGKERAKAIHLIEQAIALDPTNQRIRDNLSIIRENARRSDTGSIEYPVFSTGSLAEAAGQMIGVPSSLIRTLDSGIQRNMAALV